ncbi:RES family NAD+ phosphorylase [Agrobacterium tumefaciens]|uniref:RES family NAD+ phosphorylase n=1 Tax=Agrobacterium tumefaciens TaxID=358 RepID=UPI001F2041D6|nr:RES family NAD+ phosphorylase [Agrobacterium tumefaciens]
MATPLGMGFGNSRFSSLHRRFRLAYIAQDLPTAIAETIVCDRFEASASRVLDKTEFEEWAIAEVSAVDPLTVLDLRTTGLPKLGVSTDTARAKAHSDGQALSEAVYGTFDVKPSITLPASCAGANLSPAWRRSRRHRRLLAENRFQSS